MKKHVDIIQTLGCTSLIFTCFYSMGISTTATFDLMQKTTSITDHNGNTVYYEYDKYQRIVKTTDEEGNATTYEHDNNGNVIAVISALGTRTEIVYDKLNRHSRITEADGASVEFTYDNGGNLTQVTDPLGNVTTREYDLAGQLTKLTDPMGNATQFTYTSLGQVETITNAHGEKVHYNYYPGGRLKSTIMPCGESTNLEYDKSGNICKVTDASGGVSMMVYDSLNRVVETINPIGHSKKFAYNTSGHMTHITDENGNTTEYKYSPMGDIVEAIDAMGHSTKYAYDNMSRLTKQEQCRMIEDASMGRGAGAIHKEYQITTYQRNKKGEVVAVTSPLGDVIKYTYDKVGRVISMLDEDGLETLYEYNLVGRLAKVSYADGKTVEFSYDALRRLTEMKDWLGTTTIELDILGRVTTVTDHGGNEIGYTWDALGQREKLTYPDGTEVKYEYTASGKLSRVISGSDITSYSYNDFGRIAERILPDNTRTAYEFTPIGALASLTHSRNGNILDQFKYEYDHVGNVTGIEKHRSGIETDNGVFKYSYDPLGRLVEAANNNGSKTYTYDSLGNRLSSVQNDISTLHSYNGRNQLTQTIENGITTDYSYDKRGNLIQLMQNGQLDAGYTFDATNMMVSTFTQDKGAAEYAYNGFNKRVHKLESLHSTPGVTLPDPTSEVKYVLDMTRPYDDLLTMQSTATQDVASTTNQNFIWGDSLLAASGNANDTENVSTFYYLQDHLGSPIRLLHTGQSNYTNPTGGNFPPVEMHNTTPLAYDEFGVPSTPEASTNQSAGKYNNPFGFTGYQHDNVSGMQYAQARYYNPHKGRFMAEDPIKDSNNWYNYCGGNPATFRDPSGLYRIYVSRRRRDLCPEWYLVCPEEFPEAWENYNSQREQVIPGVFPTDLRPWNLKPQRQAYTVAISFSSTLGELVRLGVSFTPFIGRYLPGLWDTHRYVGGPSVHTVPTDIASTIVGFAFSKLFKAEGAIKAVQQLAKRTGAIEKLLEGLYKINISAGDRLVLDDIAQHLFYRNSIPTYHTIIADSHVRPGSDIDRAARLLTAQMNATYMFIANNASYFLNTVMAGQTLSSISRELSQLNGDELTARIDEIITLRRQQLDIYAMHNYVQPGQIEEDIRNLKHFLQNFRAISNLVNTAFLAAIQKATCTATGECLCVPPIGGAGSPPPGGDRIQDSSREYFA